MEARASGNLIIISAPSGAGKTTVVQATLKRMNGVKASISFTSRTPRPGETNGVDYHFVSRAEFKEMINQGKFLEWAEVHSNLYGTSAETVSLALSSGQDIILTIDVQGADKARQVFPEAISVFLLPPSFEVLEERLTGRGPGLPDDFELRMANARKEMACYRDYDYLVVNDQLEEAVNEFESIILAGRCRRRRREQIAETIIEGLTRE